MGSDWTQLECEAIVEDHLVMLGAELRQEKYSKTEHRRNLKAKLRNRTDGSIEFKHQNISAVLILAGHVYIPGYKPAWNFQDLLAEVVKQRIESRMQEIVESEEALIRRSASPVKVERISDFLVEPPHRPEIHDHRESAEKISGRVDYAEREARNRYLGRMGEEFVYDFERMRLKEIGRDDLIVDIEWTSDARGDGTGYDIRSFRGATDEPLYIEVKTTNSGKYQPFLISANEVEFASQNSGQYSLYRVFEFAKAPRLFCLYGLISLQVELMPKVFAARF